MTTTDMRRRGAALLTGAVLVAVGVVLLVRHLGNPAEEGERARSSRVRVREASPPDCVSRGPGAARSDRGALADEGEQGIRRPTESTAPGEIDTEASPDPESTDADGEWTPVYLRPTVERLGDVSCSEVEALGVGRAVITRRGGGLLVLSLRTGDTVPLGAIEDVRGLRVLRGSGTVVLLVESERVVRALDASGGRLWEAQRDLPLRGAALTSSGSSVAVVLASGDVGGELVVREHRADGTAENFVAAALDAYRFGGLVSSCSSPGSVLFNLGHSLVEASRDLSRLRTMEQEHFVSELVVLARSPCRYAAWQVDTGTEGWSRLAVLDGGGHVLFESEPVAPFSFRPALAASPDGALVAVLGDSPGAQVLFFDAHATLVGQLDLEGVRDLDWVSDRELLVCTGEEARLVRI